MDLLDIDQLNEKYSVKNLLFYRAIPQYVIKEPINGHKLYACTDCGDRFLLESSYQDHINRQSMKIRYNCRRCNPAIQQKIFYNRCNLLAHIRSHSFKTATINVSDLNIELLPLTFYKFHLMSNEQQQTTTENLESGSRSHTCTECNEDITASRSPNKDRVSHYMKYTNRFYSCPVCLLTLPTICALKTHLRVHLRHPPYFCPECGIQLANKVVNYPFSHDCEGFNMMRATVRLMCTIPQCQSTPYHPQDYKKHLKLDHIKKVFKCPYCVVACFSEATICKHLDSHQVPKLLNPNNIPIFYQCEMCPGRLVLQTHLETHINTHTGLIVYPCWTCGSRFKNIRLLIEHHINNHITSNHAMMEDLRNTLKSSLGYSEAIAKKKMFRVVKRCDQCLRSFAYKCIYDDIKILPNACPYKCTPASKSLLLKNKSKSTITHIKCPLCKSKIDQRWENVKKHFALKHKNHKCLDCNISLKKMNLRIRRKRIRKRTVGVTSSKTRRVKKRITDRNDNENNETVKDDTSLPNFHLTCVKCHRVCVSKEDLEIHLKDHRDRYMAYQCMECGESFVVKPSFTTHLLVNHGILDVDDYIDKKECYNGDALITCHEEPESDMPLEENQCKICREIFKDSDELRKHFRVHGMAFLIKNSEDKTSPP